LSGSSFGRAMAESQFGDADADNAREARAKSASGCGKRLLLFYID